MANYNKSFTLTSPATTTTQNTLVGDTITCTINSNNLNWIAVASNCTVNNSSGTNGTAIITTNSSGSYSCEFSYTANKTTYKHTVSGTATADNTPENFVSGGWVGSGVTNTYYYATFQAGVTASTSSVGTYTVGSVTPGTSISLANVSGYTATAAAYSINGSGTGWITSSSTVSNGDVIRWRVLSPSTASTTARYRLTIGTVSRDLQITTASPNYTAPVISSVTNTTTAGPNVTATVNLSSNGSGGSLQYAQTTSNSVPSSGWQTSNQFSHPRGTTRYYWASQAQNTSGAYSSSVSKYVGYLTADTTVTPTPTSQTIANGATSASVTVGSVARSTEGVAVRVNNGSTNLATATGNNQTLTWTSSLPTAGNTTTYEIFTRRATSAGGDGSTWTATNDTFTVTRSQPNATLDLNIGISNYTGNPTRYFHNNTAYTTGTTTVVMTGLQSSYTHELTGCGADTIYYASHTAGTSQGSTNTYGNLSPIGRTWTTASTRTLRGMSGSTSSISPSSSTYSQGSVVYIWAVLNPNSPGGSTISNSTTMTYTGFNYIQERPDTLISCTPSTTTLGSVSGHPGGTGDTSSPTVNVTNDSSGTQYRLYTDNISRWVSTYVGGGSSTTDFTISYDEASNGQPGTGFTELPSNGNTYTYYVQARCTAGTTEDQNNNSATGAFWVNTGASFTIARSTADTQPDPFTGNNSLGGPSTVATGVASNSNTVTISGLSSGTSVNYSFTNNSYTKVSKNGGAFSTSGGTVVNTDTLQVQITASSTAGVTRSTTLSVGSPAVTGTYSVTSSSSTGGSTGTGSSGGTGSYGLEVFDDDGTSLVLGSSYRYPTVLALQGISLSTSGTTSTTISINMSGVTTSNTTVNFLGTAPVSSDALASIVTFGSSGITINIANSGISVLNATVMVTRW